MHDQRVYISSYRLKSAISRQMNQQARRERNLSDPAFTRQALRSARLMDDNLTTRRTTSADSSTFDLVHESLARMQSLQEGRSYRPTIAQKVIIEYITRDPDTEPRQATQTELATAFGEDQMEYVVRQIEELRHEGLIEPSANQRTTTTALRR